MNKNTTKKSKWAITFTNKQPIYELKINDKTNREILIKTTKWENLQELVNSNKEVAIDLMYQKYINGESVSMYNDQLPKENIIFDTTNKKEDEMFELAPIIEKAELYREAKKLPPNLTIEQIYQQMDNEAQEKKQWLKRKNKEQTQLTKEEREKLENYEKKNEQQNQQKNIQENSEQNT